MQTVALISSILSPFLVFGAAYLSLRQARKKLREDAALHLYQKQIEACSAIIHQVHRLAIHLTYFGFYDDDHQDRMDSFLEEIHKVQLYLPSEVLEALRTFWSEAQRFPATPFQNLGSLREALFHVVDEARRSLKIDPISSELLSIELKPPTGSEPPRKASSGHGGS